jgi:GntR family transcriptional regulator, transcriptional repressor for pyruvate dehydrogenase complex
MKINKLHELLQQLESDILRGEYVIGSRFPSERQISERYGVSRITTRDAVSRLCQMGLLRKAPQSGTFVNDYLTETSIELLVRIMQSTDTMDGAALISLLEFRRVNEVFAARKAAVEITPQGMGEMEEWVRRGLSATNDISLLCDCDYEIHRAVIRHSGNLVLALLFNSFRTVYRHYVAFYYSLPLAGERTMRHYSRLVAAFAARDREYAAHIMETLLVEAENAVKDAISYNGESTVSLSAFRKTVSS